MKLSQDVKNLISQNLTNQLEFVNALSDVNLSLYNEVVNAGETIQVFNQKVAIPRDTAFVLADLAPQFNWAHPCRYYLYDANTGERYDEVEASFPPAEMRRNPEKVEMLHAPVQPFDTAERRVDWEAAPALRLNVLANHPGERYAILYSGDSENRHVNDMEFLYRTLIDVYGFIAANIHVLNHDGTLNYDFGPKPVGNWPGDNTAYRMVVTGQGTRADFQATLATLAGQMEPADLLFIHTNNHGGGPCDGVDDYCLCDYDAVHDWVEYLVDDFVADLGVLPQFDVLMVMMEQCRSGGFIDPIINNTPARWTHVVTAVAANDYSRGGADFDPFAEDWIAGITGQYPDGTAPAPAVDTNGDGRISAAEAFAYADAVHTPGGAIFNVCPTPPPVTTCQSCGGAGGHNLLTGDSPTFDETPAGCGDWIFLGQRAHDLFLRDNLQDHGLEPLIGGGISCSPDIILYRQELLDPDATLLTVTAQDNDMLGESVEFGQDNFIYLRVQNRSSDPTSGTAKVYWTEVSALPTPASWHLIDEVAIPNVPPQEMIVVGPIRWHEADIPAEGHYCFVGLIQSGDDPAPDKDAILTVYDFHRLIRESNNATWKNFDVYDMFANSIANMTFHIQGWPRIGLSVDLLIDVSELPEEMEIRLRILKRLSQPAAPEALELFEESPRYQKYEVQSGAYAYLRGIDLKPSDDTQASLEVVVPEGVPDGVYRLAAAQIVDGNEVGRVTRVLAVGEYPFLANRNSGEVHVGDCIWARKVAPGNRVAYKDLERALNHGYNGCHYCLREFSTD